MLQVDTSRGIQYNTAGALKFAAYTYTYRLTPGIKIEKPGIENENADAMDSLYGRNMSNGRAARLASASLGVVREISRRSQAQEGGNWEGCGS